jgi:hypothetical protein
MAERVFTFSVDDRGNFTYEDPSPLTEWETDPPKDWAYCSCDKLKFQTQDGPFTMKLRRTDSSTRCGLMTSPFGGQLLESEYDPESKTHFIEVKEICDGLTPAQRKEIYDANYPPGFLAKYRYLIGVLKNGKAMADDDQFGTYTC